MENCFGSSISLNEIWAGLMLVNAKWYEKPYYWVILQKERMKIKLRNRLQV